LAILKKLDMHDEIKGKAHLGVCVDKDVLEKIDRSRGLVKRSTFVNDLLRRLLLGHSDEQKCIDPQLSRKID